MRMSRWGRAIMACGPVLLACLLWAGSAEAHSALIGSTPEQGAVLPKAPRTIQLEFNQNIDDIAPAVVLRDDADAVISRRTPTLDRHVVSTPFPMGLDDGTYSIVYRVVSEDGHPIHGVIRFAIGKASTTVAPTRPDAPTGTSPIPVVIALAAALVVGGAAIHLLNRPAKNRTPTDRRAP